MKTPGTKHGSRIPVPAEHQNLHQQPRSETVTLVTGHYRDVCNEDQWPSLVLVFAFERTLNPRGVNNEISSCCD